jgi:hypothetical protein
VANKAKEKLNCKKKQEEELAAKKTELLPELQLIMAEYKTERAVAADLNKLTVQMLINIICYYCDSMPKGLSLMKKPDLVSEVANQIVISPNATSSTEIGGKDDMDIIP